MSKYMRRLRKLAVLPTAIALIGVAACSGEKKTDSVAQDSTLNRDLQLANRDSAAQPQLSDVPARTAPAAKPAPTPVASATRPTRREPAPAPVRTPRPTTSTTASGNTVTRTPGRTETALGTIAAGSSISLTSNSRVCTNTNQVGQTISATVVNSVTGSNGAVIPAGATAQLEITQLKRSDNMNDKIQIGFRVQSISFGGHTYPVTATVSSAQVDRVRNEPGSKDAQKVATGAAVGAIIGQIMGHNTKSTIIGAGVGAAAGAGTAAATANYEGCVPSGGNITIALDNSIQVHT
ncbi:MAG: YMGG-like glycine zipper-containing protein [Gemmatimonadota bacterium]|nr:YMGG-like glycine zipper-containing protein [Gemmatimonadota bacterium]